MITISSLKQFPAIMNTFGEKLRYFREVKELTQEDLAKALVKRFPKASITRNDIANWENDRHAPRTDKALAVCDFFKISLDELFRDKISIKMILKNRAKPAIKAHKTP